VGVAIALYIGLSASLVSKASTLTEYINTLIK
jgi:hypothetical protein